MSTRILFVHGITEIGGAETELLHILKCLDRGKYIPMVACPAKGPLVEALQQAKIPVASVVLPSWRKIKDCWKIPIGVVQLSKLLKTNRIDILHVNDYWWAPIAWLAARRQRIPCVVHIRQQIESCRVRQYWMSKYDKLLAVSESIRRVVVRNGVSPQQVEVLYGGIDCDAIRPVFCGEVRVRFEIADDAVVIGTVANLFERKGHEYLLEAIALVRNTVSNVHAIIVGEGDPKYRQKLEHIIQERNLGQYVTLVGFQKDVFSILSVFDIFILPSILEGFGIVLLEAMAMGKPIIATGVGGPSECVVDGETGIIVPPGNSEALASAILKLLHDPQQRKEMGIAGRRRVETSFSFSQTMAKLNAVYDSLIQNGI